MNPLETQRRALCAACQGKCWTFTAGKLEPANPAAGCPRRIWEGGMPAGPVSLPPAPVVAPVDVMPTEVSLRRVLRGWRRAGLRLVTRAQRRHRAAICAGCEHVRKDARTGLVGCGAGCNCGAAGVSIYRADAKCKLGKWGA